MKQTEIGIAIIDRQSVASILSALLADETILYIKTRNAHWNIEGPDFIQKHLLFESQYNALAAEIDNIAERIRTIGHYAPATLAEYLKLTHLIERTTEKNTGEGFIKYLLADHESIIVILRSNIKIFAEVHHDLGTSDFITGLMETHEKMAWFLRAHLTN